MAEPAKKRTRLSPERRQAAILDAAAQLVLDDGLTNLTMAKVAAEAEVSKALIYAYFPNMEALLYAVYERETQLLNQQHMDTLRAPHSFEEMVQVTSRISRAAKNDRAKLVERLANDPLLAERVSHGEQANRARVVKFLSREISEHFDLPKDIAVKATRLALRFEDDPKDSENTLDEIWGAMIVGAMTELERRYGKQPKDKT